MRIHRKNRGAKAQGAPHTWIRARFIPETWRKETHLQTGILMMRADCCEEVEDGEVFALMEDLGLDSHCSEEELVEGNQEQ